MQMQHKITSYYYHKGSTFRSYIPKSDIEMEIIRICHAIIPAEAAVSLVILMSLSSKRKRLAVTHDLLHEERNFNATPFTANNRTRVMINPPLLRFW